MFSNIQFVKSEILRHLRKDVKPFNLDLDQFACYLIAKDGFSHFSLFMDEAENGRKFVNIRVTSHKFTDYITDRMNGLVQAILSQSMQNTRPVILHYTMYVVLKDLAEEDKYYFIKTSVSNCSIVKGPRLLFFDRRYNAASSVSIIY